MITTQRVIIYRTDDDPDLFNFEIINSYDFSTSMTVIPIGLFLFLFTQYHSFYSNHGTSPFKPN